MFPSGSGPHNGGLRTARPLLLPLGCALAISGCAKYHPKPLDPPRLERQLRERALPAGELDLEALTAAAFEFHSDLVVARARVRAAEAGVITAKARPNPSLAVGGGYTDSPESPVVFRFEPSLVIETARKRDYRILESVKLGEAARLEYEEARWKVRSRVRTALVERVFAARALELLRAEAQARAQSVALLEKRLAAGEIARPVVDAARIEAAGVAVAARAAEGQAAESLANLAAAVGVARDALAKATIRIEELDTPPPLEQLPFAKLQQAGLLHRIDVRRMLLEYAAAEAHLQLQVALQYPDIQIGPGYSFDEGHYKIAPGPSLAVPLFNRNRGPIAEAEAKRDETAGRFLALQAQAIAEMESSQARYQGALAEYAETDSRTALARRQELATEKALAAGEEDRVAVAGQKVQSAVLARLRLESWHKAHMALGALEDSVQNPLRGREVNP